VISKIKPAFLDRKIHPSVRTVSAHSAQTANPLFTVNKHTLEK